MTGSSPQDEISTLLKALIALSYMFSSSFLTFVNKYIYEKYQFKEPKILFLVQCCWNVTVCLAMMTYK